MSHGVDRDGYCAGCGAYPRRGAFVPNWPAYYGMFSYGFDHHTARATPEKLGIGGFLFLAVVGAPLWLAALGGLALAACVVFALVTVGFTDPSPVHLIVSGASLAGGYLLVKHALGERGRERRECGALLEDAIAFERSTMSVSFEQLAEVTVGAASPRQGRRTSEAARLLEHNFSGERLVGVFRFQRVYLKNCPGQKSQKIWNAQLVFLKDSWVLFPDLAKPKLRRILLTGRTRDVARLGKQHKRDRVSLFLADGGELILAGGGVRAMRDHLESIIAAS